MSNVKISIVMPTYNDENSIEETFDSVKDQTYENYELIIVNDGSTDGAEKVIKNYIEKYKLEGKFKYFYQENADQLNALKTAIKHIDGDYVYILHSDDKFDNNEILQKLANECEKNPQIEAFIPKYLPIIDKDSKPNGIQKVNKFKKNKNYIKFLILIGGINVFVDFALFKKEIFVNEVYYNYLTWNRPYWTNIEKNSTLKLKSLDFPTFKYRVFEENYINSELGLVNVYNGVLRTFVDATQQYSFPFFKLQRFIYRFNSKIKCPNIFCGIAFHKPMKNKLKAIKCILPQEVWKYPYYKSILGFYSNYKNERAITLTDFPEKAFVGSDMRSFNKLMLKNKLPKFYTDFMAEVEKGFTKVIVNKKDENKVRDLLHFFCLTNVNVKIK